MASAPQGVCYAVSDGPCSWVELEFSGKTKISLFYDSQMPPAPVAALLGQVDAIHKPPVMMPPPHSQRRPHALVPEEPF